MTGSAPAPRPGGGSAARLGRPGGRRTHRVGRRLPAPCPHVGATAASGGAGPARRTDDGGGALAGASVAPDAARGEVGTRWAYCGRRRGWSAEGVCRRGSTGNASPMRPSHWPTATAWRSSAYGGSPRNWGSTRCRSITMSKAKRRCSTRCPRRCSPRWRPSRTATAPPVGRRWPAGRRTSTGPWPTGTRGSSRCW